MTMANGTRSRCMGVVEDVPINLGGDVIMADFVVVESPQVKTKEMDKDMLLLGRPFINSTRMIIDLIELSSLSSSTSSTTYSRARISIEWTGVCCNIVPGVNLYKRIWCGGGLQYAFLAMNLDRTFATMKIYYHTSRVDEGSS